MAAVDSGSARGRRLGRAHLAARPGPDPRDQRDLRPLVAETGVDPAAWRRDLQAQAERARALLTLVREGDALGARLGAMVEFAAAADRFEGDALASTCARWPSFPSNFGHKAHWTTPEALEEARAIAAWTSQAPGRVEGASSAALHARLVKAVLEVVAATRRARSERGVLDFLDLLLKARDALRDSEAVRRYFRERFRVVIIDEFQDTDPCRWRWRSSSPAGRPARSWWSATPSSRSTASGGRRSRSSARVRGGGAQARARVLHLTQNFRSRAAILRFVNRAFARSSGLRRGGPAAYEAIAPPPG
jgi:ATP-dependent helicase/nuclease subunit A